MAKKRRKRRAPVPPAAHYKGDETKLVECSFLIPIIGRNDRTGYVQGVMLDRYGGCSVDEYTTQGVWRDSKGKVIEDRLRRVYVAVPKDKVQSLRIKVSSFCGVFGQQCMYFCVAGEVELVTPALYDSTLGFGYMTVPGGLD